MNKDVPLIHCDQLVLDNEIKDELNLTAHTGSIISIIGPDQDNKSDCLETISDVVAAESGHLYLNGIENTKLNKDDWIHMRTQFAYIHANTAILSAANAIQNLMLPAIYHKTGERDVLINRAQQLLTDINAGDDLELLPAHLKPEQRFKIAVARALMLNPRALLLNSPFTALELPSIKPFQQFLLNRVRDQNLLLILVTHDIKFALKHSDQIIYVSEKRMLQFDKNNRIQDCDNAEVSDYLAF